MDFHDRHDVRGNPPVPARSRGGGVVVALVLIALVLAIGFFYLTNDRREDRRADALTKGAAKIDETTRVVGDAARNAVDTLD